MKYFLLILLLLTGCAPWSTNHNPEYDLAQSIVIEKWIDQFGDLQDETWDALENYTLVEMDFDEVNPCLDPLAIGCYYPTNTIFIDTGRTPAQRGCTFMHELEHLMSYYEFGDLQMFHDNKLLWEEFGRETVEYKSCKEYKESR